MVSCFRGATLDFAVKNLTLYTSSFLLWHRYPHVPNASCDASAKTLACFSSTALSRHGEGCNEQGLGMVVLLLTGFWKTSFVPFLPFACCKFHLAQGSALVNSPKTLDISWLMVCCLLEDWGSFAMSRGSFTDFQF